MSLRSPFIGVASVLSGVVALLVVAPAAFGDDTGRITGRVLGGPEGVALVDAGVQLDHFDAGLGDWRQFSFLRTDADGRYRFAGLPEGRYRVCANSSDGVGPISPVPKYLPRCWRAAPNADSADEIVLDPGTAVGAVSIRLPARGLIRGQVTDPAGDPVTGGYAQSYWREAGHWVNGPYGVFDGDGRYELRLDGGRVYHVCFQPFDGEGLAFQCWQGAPSLPSSTGIRGVELNRTVDGIDAQLDVGGGISGLITGYPTGTQGSIGILAYRYDAGEWWAAGWSVVEPWTSPNPFEIASLPAGTYRVCFDSQDYEFFPVFASECVGGPTAATGTDIEVTAGGTTAGADVDLGSPSTITGRVAGTAAPVPVQLLTASGEPIFERLTAADGTYGFSGLPGGSYKLAFNRKPAETRQAARFYRSKPEEVGVAGATPVELADGELISGISSALVTGGSITGRVVDRDGLSVPGCEVRADTPDGALVTREGGTNAGGGFDVGGLSTGAYRLRIGGGSCGIGREDLYFDAGSPSQLTVDPALADPVDAVLGQSTAVPGDLVITQLRNLEAPSIGGTPRVGRRLTADAGSWSPPDVTFAYRWYADGALLPGATRPRYRPTVDQVGSRIRVHVTASKTGYPDAGRTSAPTAPIASGS